MFGDRARQETSVVWQETSTSRDQRPSRGLTVWFTGLSAAGKSTVAAELERRVGEVAKLLADAGVVAIASLISPYRAPRDAARQAHVTAGLGFVEVFIDTPLRICEARDPKGLYAQARTGEITGFTGVDHPYEPPESPEIALHPSDGAPADMAEAVLEYLATSAENG